MSDQDSDSGLITPLPTPLLTPIPSTAASPYKRLRSCLSPSRSVSPCDGSSPSPSPVRPTLRPESRSTSFDSEAAYPTETGMGMGLVWKRKSVRWEGEDEGCAVTSYHPTWPATEYDRTPLDPPSAAERTCVLPARNSRCIYTNLECFSTSLSSPQYTSNTIEEVCDSPNEMEGFTAKSLLFDSPLDSDDQEEDEKEWEECMQRRRMMFARLSSPRSSASDSDDEDVEGDEEGNGKGRPELDGYKSISAKLVELLRSKGCESPGSTTPLEGIIEEEEEGQEEGYFSLGAGQIREERGCRV